MTESVTHVSRRRRRGVRASRIKLEDALARSDLEKKTQAALANRIADLEHLDAAPKDLVSKVFRERLVDHQTLVRVANALGVEPGALYADAATNGLAADDDRAAMSVAEPGRAPFAFGADFNSAPAIALAAFSAIILVLFAVSAVRPSGALCGIREGFTPPHVEDDRIGFLVARFANDPENLAQQYLAAAFAADPSLSRYASVVAICARPRWDGPGDYRRRLEKIRLRGRGRLEAANAHVMLWGYVDGEDIVVRLISTRPDVSPFALEVDERPLRIAESDVEVRVPLGRESAALADLKRLALDLIDSGSSEIAGMRDEAKRSFRSSADWLRAAIVSKRNLLRTIDAEIDTQQWTSINMQLCYDLRLLGDYESSAANYTQSLDACERALRHRPPQKFPHDYAALQINKASALTRLHYYERDRTNAMVRLRSAEEALLSVIDGTFAGPQQAITAQRNLGVVYLRMGELTASDTSVDYFANGIELLKQALAAQDAGLQPLDWAITQQNICLAQYQHGARLGPDAAEMVADAKSRCADAVHRLSQDDTPLDWAMAQNNLAAATAILSQFEKDADGLDAAIDAFTATQVVYVKERLPGKWAEIELNLGELYCNLAILRKSPALFEPAKTHLDAALEVFIETGNARYRSYAQSLVSEIDSCDRNAISQCVCGG